MSWSRERLYAFILASALLNIIFVFFAFKPGEYIFKPLTTFLIILLCYGAFFAKNDQVYTRLFLIALVFSLFGDIFLMFEGEFLFLAGLTSFLAAHLFYIFALAWGFDFIRREDYYTLAGVGLVAVLLFWRLAAGMIEAGQFFMLLPVALYAFVISLMVWLALGSFFRTYLGKKQQIFVSAGAILFFISDAVLAYNRFAAEISHASIIIISFYFLGQFFLARSAYRD